MLPTRHSSVAAIHSRGLHFSSYFAQKSSVSINVSNQFAVTSFFKDFIGCFYVCPF